MMEIDTEQKRWFVLEFLESMKNHPHLLQFVNFDPMVFGYFDYEYIAQTSLYNIDKIVHHFKTNKTMSFNNFKNIIEKMFTGLSDYLFADDELQGRLQIAFIQIQNFETEFYNKFYNGQAPTSKASFQNQIEMVYFLKNYEDNEEALKEVGKNLNIMTEETDELIFDLGANSQWQQFFRRKGE